MLSDQFIAPRKVSLASTSPPSISTASGSAHRLLEGAELEIIDDFIDSPKGDEPYNGEELASLMENLPPTVLGFSSSVSQPTFSYRTPSYQDHPDVFNQFRQTHQSIQSHNSIVSPSSANLIGTPLSLEPPQIQNHSLINDHHCQRAFPLHHEESSATDRSAGSGRPNTNPFYSATEPLNRCDLKLFSSSANFERESFPVTFKDVNFVRPGMNTQTCIDTIHLENGGQNLRSPITGILDLNLCSLQYGNDDSFGEGCFIPPPHQKTEEEVVTTKLKTLTCLEHGESAAYTPSSSLKPRPEEHQRFEAKAVCDVLNQVSPKSRSRQRKALPGEKIYQPSKTSMVEGIISVKHSSKRQKSRRENLNAAQKRVKHVNSEQRRRDSIKEGYLNITRLVPGLRVEDHSKNGILNIVVKWFEEMIEGNLLLGEQLKEVNQVCQAD